MSKKKLCEVCTDWTSSRCKCGEVYYCCSDHQKRDWARHKESCPAIRKGGRDSKATGKRTRPSAPISPLPGQEEFDKLAQILGDDRMVALIERYLVSRATGTCSAQSSSTQSLTSSFQKTSLLKDSGSPPPVTPTPTAAVKAPSSLKDKAQLEDKSKDKRDKSEDRREKEKPKEDAEADSDSKCIVHETVDIPTPISAPHMVISVDEGSRQLRCGQMSGVFRPHQLDKFLPESLLLSIGKNAFVGLVSYEIMTSSWKGKSGEYNENENVSGKVVYCGTWLITESLPSIASPEQAHINYKLGKVVLALPSKNICFILIDFEHFEDSIAKSSGATKVLESTTTDANGESVPRFGLFQSGNEHYTKSHPTQPDWLYTPTGNLK